MNISGVTLEQFQRVVDIVSWRDYEGNLVTHPDGRDLSGPRVNRCRARVWVHNSRAHGARTSWSDRHIKAASWQAYRDVLAELFRRYPDAVVRTSLATYRGAEGFAENYPETYWHNAGSQFQPAYIGELSV